MSSAYEQLLDAAIRHLEGLRSRGTRHIAVSPDTLSALSLPPAREPAIARTKIAPALRVPESPGDSRGHSVFGFNKAAAAAPQIPSSTMPAARPMHSEMKSADTAKTAAYAELQRRALACRQCAHLAASRKSVVFGVGNIDSPLLFVGEAPGADEDEQGEPFVGKAGQLLTKIIEAMGRSRADVYIANIMKCRPDTPGQSAGNRKPTSDEMKTCIPYLHEQIDLIKPKVLVALGATAVDGLLGKTAGISKLRGNWQMYRGIPLMPTYHPAYLLRNQAMTEKRKVWEDMLQVMEKLEMNVSEKQRKYFLKA